MVAGEVESRWSGGQLDRYQQVAVDLFYYVPEETSLKIGASGGAARETQPLNHWQD